MENLSENPEPSSDNNVNNKRNRKNKKNETEISLKHLKIDYKWVLIVFLISFIVGAIFSVLSELVMQNASLLAVIIVLTVLLFISIVFDCIGLAFASAQEEPFLAMASRNVKGAKKAIKLLKNANKISSFCQDIMGDICGVISGAAGATAVVIVAGDSEPTQILIASAIISGLIAAFTIAGKASTKKIAMKNYVAIVMTVSRFLSKFKK